ECLSCHKRFTSYERIEEIPYMAVKKDGRREAFSREKLMGGLMRAVEKRPVPLTRLEAIVDEVEGLVPGGPGGGGGDARRARDKVAYVRFASVYRQFDDVDEFMNELRRLMERK